VLALALRGHVPRHEGNEHRLEASVEQEADAPFAFLLAGRGDDGDADDQRLAAVGVVQDELAGGEGFEPVDALQEYAAMDQLGLVLLLQGRDVIEAELQTMHHESVIVSESGRDVSDTPRDDSCQVSVPYAPRSARASSGPPASSPAEAGWTH